jgi:hypothetical protein
MVHFGFAHHLTENLHTCYLLHLAVVSLGKLSNTLEFVHKMLCVVGGLSL